MVLGKPKTISDVLLHQKRIEAEQVKQVVEVCAKSGQEEHEVLLTMCQIPRADIYSAMAALGDKPVVSKLDDLPPWDVVLTEPGQPLHSPRAKARDHAVIYHSVESSEWPSLGSSIPCFIVCVRSFADSRELPALIERCASVGYGALATLVFEREELMSAFFDLVENAGARRSITASIEDAPLHKLFDEIAYRAFRLGASDIHLTSTFGRAFVKFRVHGMLEHYTDMSVDQMTALMASAYNTLVERGSTKGGYNPLETQDGLIERRYPEGLVRFRYNHMPLAPDGVDHTLRIIPIGVTQKRKSLAELGYSPDQIEAIDRAFANRGGMILFAGTTGSGKSTTMANKLMEVAALHPSKKIRTIEEPVEYRIVGAYQTPVKRIKGDSSDFLTMMRAALRADPDILAVGEIRDIHTAELAIHAVRSGHLCISSIHADSSIGIYDRLAGMGVPRSDLSGMGLIAGFVYQALVPVVCPACSIPFEQASRSRESRPIIQRIEAVARDWDEPIERIRFHRPGGCQACHGRGVIRRTVAAEFHRPTRPMLEAIRSQNAVKLYELNRMQSAGGRPKGDMTGRDAMEHAVWKMFQGQVCPTHVEDSFRLLDDLPPYDFSS